MFQSLVISISQLMLKPTQKSTISLITFLGHKMKYTPEKLVKIRLIVMKWQQICEIQDDGGSHL
jgi:hypothetical protein